MEPTAWGAAGVDRPRPAASPSRRLYPSTRTGTTLALLGVYLGIICLLHIVTPSLRGTAAAERTSMCMRH